MKKTICFVLIISLVYSSILQVYASDHLGSLTYWYSSSGTIYHWNATSRQIYCNNISGIGSSSFPFLTSIQYGASLWSASVNLSLSTNTTNSSSPIYFYGGDQTSVEQNRCAMACRGRCAFLFLYKNSGSYVLKVVL